MSTLELHAYTDKGVTHVCTIHRSAGDETPLQMISAQELARLRAAEADLVALQAARIDQSDVPAA
ncbi:hypothetical protein [Massilia alkalitolerans]|uniref:hypothetical protein n=1 Tax=Massilia alkalitolerans TaxID=286638 RepID=UPI000418E6FC|nr:hypothetical protein [Massilia alkalitolerans]